MNKAAHILYKTARLVWKITKPVTVGVRVILIKDKKVLLVKHSYGEHWYLPGGKVEKGETFEQAIKREAKEELDADLHVLKLFGAYNNFYEGKNDSIIIFLCEDFFFSGKTDREIEAYELFDLSNLPQNVSPGSKKRINEYINGQIGSFGLW